MKFKHLWKSFVVLGIVLIVLSFYPSYILATYNDLVEGQSFAHLIECPENPYLFASQRYDQPFSLYFMTPAEGSRLLNGTPLGNVTIVVSLENITQYSGYIDLHEPGLYLLFVTASNQSDYVHSYVYVLRGTPQIRILGTGLVLLALGILIHYYPFSSLIRILVRNGTSGQNEKQIASMCSQIEVEKKC